MAERVVRIHPAALEEAGAALTWYSQRSRAAALGFLEELDRAIARISEYPEQFPLHEFGMRRVVLHRFPYVALFRENDGGIQVVAIMHGHRKPGYWHDRV